MKTRLGKISLVVLFVIVIVLLAAHLIMRPAYATKIAAADDSTAIAAVQTDVDLIEILNSDGLALLQSGGNIWYVDSGATGSGTAADWTNADITIELAMVHATANNGDIIVCAPYHAETASAGTFDLDKDGVKVIGLGTGDAMTTITYDGTTDTCIMGATGDGCTIRNIKFYTATDDIASAIIVEDGCTDFIIEDCVFEATSSDEFLDAIYIHGTAANEGIIRRNRFLGDIASNTAPQSSIGFEDAHWLQIYDNEFSGDMSVAHIENKTTASNFITIKDNRFLCGYIGDAASTLDTVPAITLVATTTGWIQDNFVVTNVARPDLSIVAADCYLSGNTYNELQGAAFGAEDIGYVAGQVYVSIATTTDFNDNDLFDVDGGAIIVHSFTGMLTGSIVAAAGSVEITLDADSGGVDYDLSTAVECNGDLDGDRIVFDNTANESVFTPLTGADSGAANIMTMWYVDEGMIQMDNTDEDATGTCVWTMVWTPCNNGTKVIPYGDGSSN